MQQQSNQSGIIALLRNLTGQANILTVPRLFIDLLQNDLEGALFLSQCIYWSDKGSNDDGWFWKTFADWENELTLTYYKVNKVTQTLEQMGILETKLQKIKGAPTVHYRIDIEALSAWIMQFVEQRAEAQQPQPAAQPAKMRSTQRASKRAVKEAEIELLQPQTEGGYLLFNKLADEYGTLGRRAPVRFKSLVMKQRFEQCETRLGMNLEPAINDALAIPILELNRLIAYLGKWGTNGKRLDNKVQAQPAADAGSYTQDLQRKRDEARARVQEAAAANLN